MIFNKPRPLVEPDGAVKWHQLVYEARSSEETGAIITILHRPTGDEAVPDENLIDESFFVERQLVRHGCRVL